MLRFDDNSTTELPALPLKPNHAKKPLVQDELASQSGDLDVKSIDPRWKNERNFAIFRDPGPKMKKPTSNQKNITKIQKLRFGSCERFESFLSRCLGFLDLFIVKCHF